MRRTLLMVVVAVLSAVTVPLTATAAGAPREATAAPTAGAFELGGRPCSLIPVPATDGAMPVGPVATCPGVRPGGQVETDIGLCTFNFLFRAPDGARYIGTAGHCILSVSPTGSDVGEKVYPAGTGPEAQVDGKRVGEFAYAVLESPKDFALIRLDPGVEASPEMCHFGGPTGINDEVSPDPVTLEYFGNGVGAGMLVPARSGIAPGMPHKDHVYAVGLAVPGDSGSGVISSDGRAVGVLVTTGIHGFSFDDKGIDLGTMGITRIVPQLERAEEALGMDLEMVLAG